MFGILHRKARCCMKDIFFVQDLTNHRVLLTICLQLYIDILIVFDKNDQDTLLGTNIFLAKVCLKDDFPFSQGGIC